MADELDAQLNIKMPKRLLTTLREIEQRHGVSPADALRRLGEEMAGFYRQHGWFTFPVRIEPRLELVKIDVWKLDSTKVYHLTGDDVVADIMRQLRVPNLFASMVEHDQAHCFVAFEDHPTHWIVVHLWKGLPTADGNGLFFEALPKSSTPRARILARLQSDAEEMEAKAKFEFTRLPVESKKTGNQTATKVPASS